MPDFLLFSAANDWIVQWFTPFWILGIGCLLGLVLLAVLWGCLHLIGMVWAPMKRVAAAGPRTATEGGMPYILAVVAVLASFSVLMYFAVEQPLDMLASIARIPYAGSREFTGEIPVSTGAEKSRHEFEVDFYGDEIKSLVFESDETLVISVNKDDDDATARQFRIEAGEVSPWTNTSVRDNPFGKRKVERLYVQNRGSAPANLKVTAVTGSAYPETVVILWTAVFVVFVFGMYFLQCAFMPKVSAIALATTKSEIYQISFLLAVGLGAVALFSFVWVPYFTFGEDIKMLKDAGLTVIKVGGIILAIWAASKSIADEIDGRTALTILSKPVARREFIAGKFVGIVWVVAVLFCVLGAWFMFWTGYKPIYDGRENSATNLSWQLCFAEVLSLMPGLILSFLETVLLAAISVAISTRLPTLANFVICGTVYLLGHITPMIVESGAGRFEVVAFVASLVATVFPVLDYFDAQTAISAGKTIPLMYLVWSTVYCAIYGAIAMLLALVLFEDRDLA